MDQRVSLELRVSLTCLRNYKKIGRDNKQIKLLKILFLQKQKKEKMTKIKRKMLDHDLDRNQFKNTLKI